MKLFKRRVESIEFKRVLTRFYQRKVKPALLSAKHFFKSSHRYFKNHPRLRMVSIVVGIFLTIIIASSVMNTFSRKYLNSNIDTTAYDETDYKFWEKMDWNGEYTRPSLTLAYDTTNAGTETCDASSCTLEGDGSRKTPYKIYTVQEFMYVRSLGYTETLGKFYELQNNLDFTGIDINTYVGNNQGGSHFYDGFFGGSFDGNFKHIKGLTLTLSNNGTLSSNGLFPGIRGSDAIPALVKNFIIDDISYSISGTYENFRSIGALTGYIDNYAYVFNSGVLSGTINVGTTTGGSGNNNGVYVGSLIGYFANNNNIGSGYRDSTTFINGIVNAYSYANFNLSGDGSRTYIGGVLGFRGNNSNYMNAGNSLFYNVAYYGKMSKPKNATVNQNYQFVYNCGSERISSSISPMNAYYWYKGDNVDIPTNSASTQTRAIAQDANYLQSDGFVAHLNSSKKVLRFYFHDVWKTTGDHLRDDELESYEDVKNRRNAAQIEADLELPETKFMIADRLFDSAYTDVEWYISNDDFGSIVPYFPILRERTKNNAQSSNSNGTITIVLNAGDNQSVGTNKRLVVPITDQDVYVGDFVYHKIKLPYAYDVYGTTTYKPGNSEITRTFNGWKLTSVDGVYGFQNTNTKLDVMGYQYTLRDTAQAYTKNVGEVFAEGGYYLVPAGVTRVTFDSIWAYTVYLRDNKNQMAFNWGNYATNDEPTRNYNGDVIYPVHDYNGNEVSGSRTRGLSKDYPFTNMSDAYNYISQHFAHSTIYDSVIVLVGNYHYNATSYGEQLLQSDWFKTDTSVPATIKSDDKNHDLKPDYSLYIRNPNKMYFGTVRFDFINILGIPQVAGYSGMLNSWFLNDNVAFEVTETVVTDHINLFMRNASFVRVLGGYWNVYNNYNEDTNVNGYAIFGGNARADEVIVTSLYDEKKGVQNAPSEVGRILNIIGGRIKFLSYDNKPMLVYHKQTQMYIDGGYIDEYYTFYKGSTRNRAFTTINGSIINNCYGGGYADSSAIEKGANFKIKNSRIGTLFGGPKYGVIGGVLDLSIENSELDYVYGGGYGGTEYFTDSLTTNTGYSNTAYKFDTLWYGGGGRQLGYKSLWVHPLNSVVYFPVVNYHNEYYSENGNVRRLTVDTVAYYSLSKINGVTFNISNSKVNHNIYGGGLQGYTNGVIRFNLHNVEVHGSIFGAGKSGETDKVKVSESAERSEPDVINYAIDGKGAEGSTVDYTWTNSTLGNQSNPADVDSSRKLMYTPNKISSGVTETSDIYINISGDNNGKYRMLVEGNVYGGGDEADVTVSNEIHLNINDGVTIKGNVYGGGRKKTVNGNTTVIVENKDSNNPTIIGDSTEEDDSQAGGVYASGEESGVSGNATVIITGNPTIRNVYGGGMNASTNNTYVYVEGGNIKNVFGGSNTSGTVNNSNIFIGKKSPKQKDTGFVENVDICGLKIFNFEGHHNGNNNMLYHYTISNWSDVTFTEWSFKIEVADDVKTYLDWHQSHDGANFKTSWESQTITTYADGIITTTHVKPNNQGSYQENVSLNSMGSVNIGLAYNYDWNVINSYGIKSITFSGTDSNGNSYEMSDCAGSNVTNVPRPKDNRGRDKPKPIGATTYKTNTNLGNIKVDYVYGGNNIGGRTIDTNILFSKETNAYTQEVGDIYGGGNETQTGPDVINGPNIDTYKNNAEGHEDFDSQGFLFNPEHKARIVIYGGHVTGSVYGGGKGNEKRSSDKELSLMTSTPFVLVTNNSQIDGSVYGGGYATNAPLGRLVTDKDHKKDPANTLIKPFVLIDWGTVNKNVYGGGYGDVVNGGTIVYATLFNPYGIKDYVQNRYFLMNDSNSPFYGLTTVENATRNGVQSVHIKGSIFGGGERGAKESGFDYLFESVIDGTTVYLQEDKNICTLDVDGDVFGSGNFSSSAGYSDILVLNIGSFDNPKKMKSIQRAEHVYINGSYIQLSGGTDVTNKFNKTKYSFSRVENLHVGDNTTLFLEAQANMLGSFFAYTPWTAMKDNGWTFKNGDDENSFLTRVNTSSWQYIDGERRHTVSQYKYYDKNWQGRLVERIDDRINRIYLLNDRGLNIIPTEEVAQSFGQVHGMAFFGIWEKNASGNPVTSYYNKSLDRRNGSVSGFTKQDFNSYILGAHTTGMNYEQDGFVTNSYENGRLYTTIINPTPSNQSYYYWTIGNPVIAQEINLTASKYIRSGMKGVTLYNFDSKTYNRVVFEVANIDVSGLKTDANFINPTAVPTLAETDEDALKTFGLSIETSDAGWVNEGYTYFESDYNDGNRSGEIFGTTRYETAGTADFPTLIFNLENSRNIKSDVDLGYVIVTLTAHAYSRADPQTSQNSTFKIRVNMDTYYYDDNEYESSMAPGKHYKSFLSAVTNITSNSEFSTYFNMYARGVDLYQKIKEDSFTYDDVSFDHVLYSTYVLPVGTRITMLDISTNDPKYYYYIVDGTETLATEQHKKVSGEYSTIYAYPLSWFKSMDSMTPEDRYDEELNHQRSVITEGNSISTVEQYIFTVDFKDVTQHTKPINQIRNEEMFLGIRATTNEKAEKFAYPMYETLKDMHFSLYDSADVNFTLDLYDTPTEDDTIYVDDTFTFDANVNVSNLSFDEGETTYIVRNTNYYQDRLGLRVGLYHITEDENNVEKATLVSGDELAGAVFYIDGLGYAPGANGFIRLKMADFVVSVEKEIKVDLTNAEHLTSGLYEFRVTAFASADGLYAKQGDTITNSNQSFRVNLVNEHYGLLATVDDDKDVIVYSDGKTSGGNDTIETTINYFGSYQNPNIKISLKRRDYSSVNSYAYNDVNFADYFDVSLTSFSDTSQLDRTDLFDSSTMTIKKEALLNHITSADMGTYRLTLKLKPGVDLPTGTYRIMYNLYNNNKVVGDVYTYIIIKD